MAHPDLLEGFDNFSDAGVFRVRPDLALVQTVDFFPPIVDDPYVFGQIAAANALSDVYAMGATPLTALTVVGFPSRELELGVLHEILRGGSDKVLEAGARVVGGHSVVDAEIKFGLAVTGTVHPDRVVRNSAAATGDVLVLTKPLGMGALSTGGKLGRASPEALRRAATVMATLNRDASEAMLAEGARCATDVTGYGLLGHAREVAAASGVTLAIDAGALPMMDGALELARRGVVSGGAARNRRFLAAEVEVEPGIDPALVELCFDSETSGGLLVCLRPEAAPRFLEALAGRGHDRAAVVGKVLERKGTAQIVLCAGSGTF